MHPLFKSGLWFWPVILMIGCNGGGSTPDSNPAPAYSVSGRASLSQSGLAGVVLTLSGASTANQTTNVNGDYTFTGLKPGDYTISPSKAGYSFTPPSRSLHIASASIPAADFSATSNTTSTRDYKLYIVAGTFTINGNGGASMPAWGYTDVAGGGPKFPAPTLSAKPGDVVTVTVTNNHSIDHNFFIKGITSDTAPIAAGKSKTYTFTATDAEAGSHIYYDTLNNTINREMGLYGAMVIKPADSTPKTVWTGGPTYTVDYTWVIGEMDKANWNDKAGTGGAPDTSVYEPDFYFINGKGGFDAQQDPNTTITAKVGDTALVRIINGGQFPYSMHFHANHVKVVALDGVAQSTPFKQLDVVSIPPLGSMDLLYELTQSGKYLMHVHTAQAEASGGVYLNGIMAMVHIQ